MKKALNLLGLMTRAGKIITGEDLLIKGLQDKSIKLVLITEDCGKNTRKKILDKSSYYGVETITAFKISDISASIGKENRVAIGITDKGFSDKLKQLIQQGGYINNEEN